MSGEFGWHGRDVAGELDRGGSSFGSGSSGASSSGGGGGDEDSGSSTGTVCGDGVVEGEEECDDGNEIDEDSCALRELVVYSVSEDYFEARRGLGLNVA